MLKIKAERMGELEKFGFLLKHNNLIYLSYYVRPVDKQLQKEILKETLSDNQSKILTNNDVVAVVKTSDNPFWDKGVFLIKKGKCKDLDCPFDEIDTVFIQDLIKADMVEVCDD